MNETTQKPSVWKKVGHVWQMPKYYLITFILLLIGQGAGAILTSSPMGKSVIGDDPILLTASFYIEFAGIWVVTLLYMVLRKKDRPIFRALGTKTSGNNLRSLLIGLAIGAGLNAVCALAAWLNGDIVLYFDSFSLIPFLFILVCVFIQSSAEELLCRGYMYQKLLLVYKKPVVAIVGNAVFFGCLHLTNPGVTAVSFVNIIVAGMFFSFMVYYLDSIWCAMAAHAAWNFTQNIIFGLPNSGNVVPYSIFKLDAATARDSLVYNVGFGIEGTVFADVLLILGCVVLFLWGRKHSKKPIDIRQEAAE